MTRRSDGDDSSSSDASTSSDEMSTEAASPIRRSSDPLVAASEAQRNTRRKKDKGTRQMVKELMEETSKQFQILLTKQDGQLQILLTKQEGQFQILRDTFKTETKEIRKELKKLTESHKELQRQMVLVHINGSSHDDCAAPRSASSQVHLPKYRLKFTCEVQDEINKGEFIETKNNGKEISVALCDENNKIVKTGPLASATVVLVVVKGDFNEDSNQYNWSREDFERNIILKPTQGNSATGDVNQLKGSIVSCGLFNLDCGVKIHTVAKIVRNSGNKKVKLGVMVVSPTERVLEGLSNPFYVRGHDRLRQTTHCVSKRQKQALAASSSQGNGSMPTMKSPSRPISIEHGESSLNTITAVPDTTMLSIEPLVSQEAPMLQDQSSRLMMHRSSMAHATNCLTGLNPTIAAPNTTTLSTQPLINQEQAPMLQDQSSQLMIHRSSMAQPTNWLIGLNPIIAARNTTMLSTQPLINQEQAPMLQDPSSPLMMHRSSMAQATNLLTGLNQTIAGPNTTLLSTEPLISASMLRDQSHLMMHRSIMAQATNWPTGVNPTFAVRNTTTLSTQPLINQEQDPMLQDQSSRLMMYGSSMAQDTNCLAGTQFSMDHIAHPVQLVWNMPNVDLRKSWNLLDQFMPLYSCQPEFYSCSSPIMPLMTERFGSLTFIPKDVIQTARPNKGVLIELLEPDDSDEDQPLKRNLYSKYQLRFVNNVCEVYYTWEKIKASDGNLLKVALFDENNTKITSGPLSSASVAIEVLHGDFNIDGQDYWTSEEFGCSIVHPKSVEEAVLGGDHILVLANGEACLSDAFFQITSFHARTGKFKMGARMLANAQDDTIQEGISEPFRVRAHRGKAHLPHGSFGLYWFILVALVGLVGAYNSGGSWRDVYTSIYVNCRLAGAVLASVLMVVTYFEEAVRWFLAVVRAVSTWMRKTVPPSWGQEIEEMHSSGGRDEQRRTRAIEQARPRILLLATLAATITYQGGLDPPGGLWDEDGNGYIAGDPILLTTNPRLFKAFFYCNSVAFVASLVAIILVRKKTLHRHNNALAAAMILDLFGLIGAFAARSCQDVRTLIYTMALAGAVLVLVYVGIHVRFFTLDHEDRYIRGNDEYSIRKQEADDLLEKRRERLLLFAILAATITYQAGLTPPSGFWLQDDEFGHQAGGDPAAVLLYNFPRRSKFFFYCNSVSFMLSVALIILLVNKNLYRPAIESNALSVCIIIGLVGAYAAGITQYLRTTSIYIFALAAVVLLIIVFLVIHTGKEDEANNAGIIESSTQTDDGQGKWLHAKRKYLMLLGILVASITYQAGLEPPGGVWQSDGDGHEAGNPVMYDNRRSRFLTFLYSNSTSFVASIIVMILLLPESLQKEKWWLGVMNTTIVLDLLGLLVAYAAGSSRSWRTSG